MSTRVGSHVIPGGGTHVFAHSVVPVVGFATPAVIDYGSGMGGGGFAADPDNVFSSQVGGATVAQQAILDGLAQGDTFQVDYSGSEFTFTEDDGLVVLISDSGSAAADGDYVIPIQIHKDATNTIIDSTFTVTVESVPPIALLALSINAAGTKVTASFDANVQIGTGGSTGLVLTGPDGPIATSFDQVAGANAVFDLTSVVGAGQAVTATYVNPGDGIESIAGADAASFVGSPVTNNSTADIIAATLTALSVSGIQPTAVSLNFTIDDSEGTSFWAARTGGSVLSKTDIENGSGASLVNGEQDVNSPGAQSIPAGGFSAQVSYIVDIFHRDNSGNESDVESYEEFTTPQGAPVFSAIPAQALVRDQAYSLDLNDYLAPDADSISVIEGSIVALVGLSLLGTVLSGTPTGSNPANIRFRGINTSGQDDSNLVEFTITDSVPEAFSIAPLSGIEPGSEVIFGAVFPTGFLDTAALSATDCEVSISGGPWVTSGDFSPGQSFRTRLTASATVGAQTSGSVAIGGVSASAVATNRGADSIPDPLGLGSVGGAAQSSVAESLVAVVSGIDAGVDLALTVTMGEYRINGGAWVTVPGTAVLGDTIQARNTTADAAGQTVQTLINLGGVVSAFTSTTQFGATGSAEAPIINNFDPTPSGGVIDDDSTITSGALV